MVTPPSNKPTVSGPSATRWAQRRSARSAVQEQSQDRGFTVESWDIAKAQSAVLGPPNALVSELIRAISHAKTSAKTADPTTMRLFAHQSASFLVKVSPTIVSALYFAAQEYFPAQLFAIRPLTRPKLISLFDPDELLAVISATYFSRACRKIISEGTWVAHHEKLLTHAFLGGLIGRHSPTIGLGGGLIIAVLDYLSFLSQASVRIDAFEKLQENLRYRQKIFDSSLELELLSCAHQQVAFLLSTWAGFDDRIRAAFNKELIDQPLASSGTSPLGLFHTSLQVTTQLHESGTLAPEIKSRLFDKTAEETILRAASMVRSNPRQLSPWFLKSPSDLPPTVCSELGLSLEIHDDEGLAR